MKLNLMTYTALPRTTDITGKRLYNTPTGALPSVTTILSSTANKPQLESWKKMVGEKKAEEIKVYASNLGTLVHTHLEMFITGQARPRGTNHIRVLSESMANQIISNGLPQVDEIWGIEAPLYFPGLYAGTADLVGIMNGVPTLMDFKTTKKPKKLEYIEDYGLQLAAYALAHNEVYGTDIKRGCVFMVSRDGEYQQFDFSETEMENYLQLWIARVGQYYSEN